MAGFTFATAFLETPGAGFAITFLEGDGLRTVALSGAVAFLRVLEAVVFFGALGARFGPFAVVVFRVVFPASCVAVTFFRTVALPDVADLVLATWFCLTTTFLAGVSLRVVFTAGDFFAGCFFPSVGFLLFVFVVATPFSGAGFLTADFPALALGAGFFAADFIADFLTKGFLLFFSDFPEGL